MLYTKLVLFKKRNHFKINLFYLKNSDFLGDLINKFLNKIPLL